MASFWVSVAPAIADPDPASQIIRIYADPDPDPPPFRDFSRGASFLFQVRDEYRTDFDSGRGGYGKIVQQKLGRRS